MIRALISAGQLGAILHGDDLVGGLAKFGARLALRAHHVDRDAGQEMVDLMRSRVPVDSGRLLNGITMTDEGEAVVVEASAVRGDFDYAKSVEFGHLVDHGDPLGPPRPRRSRAEHGGRAEAEPYFLDSAREILEARGQRMEDVILPAARESGL